MAVCFNNLNVHCTQTENELLRHKVSRYATGRFRSSSGPALANVAPCCSQKACFLMTEELAACDASQFEIDMAGGENDSFACVRDKSTSEFFDVEKKTWKCSCSNYATYLLSCRHVAFVRRALKKQYVFPLRAVDRRWRVQELVDEFFGGSGRGGGYTTAVVSPGNVDISTRPSVLPDPSLSAVEKFRIVSEVMTELTTFLTASTGTDQFFHFLRKIKSLRDEICYGGIGEDPQVARDMVEGSNPTVIAPLSLRPRSRRRSAITSCGASDWRWTRQSRTTGTTTTSITEVSRLLRCLLDNFLDLTYLSLDRPHLLLRFLFFFRVEARPVCTPTLRPPHVVRPQPHF